MKDDHHHELFMRLLARHEPAVRAFVRAGVSGAHDVAEVMQETILVAWNKFDQLDAPEEGFGKWMCVIARYEILKFRQKKSRDRLVLDNQLIEQIAIEGVEETSQREQWLEVLELCLEKLPRHRCELIRKAYHPDVSIKELAESMQKEPNALYQMLRRLRLELAACIEKQQKLIANS